MKSKKLRTAFKKILIIFSVLVFAFAVLSISIFNASWETLAARKPSLTFEVSPQPTTASGQKTEVQYYLPYPGILPDHPFYPIKMVRDRIWLWLTTEPVKKAEVLLLFADKRLGAGKALIEGNKVNLGVTTLEKAEKYLERAAIQVEEAKKKGKNIEQVGEKLKTASLKHEEILGKIGESFGGEAKTAIERLLLYPRSVLEKVSGLF